MRNLRTPIKTPFHVFTASGKNHADFAWQVLAGTDYYWNPKLSTFIEYHYLVYTSSQIDTGDDRDLAQHLLAPVSESTSNEI